MSKIDLDDLSAIQFDVLKELGNIGAGNATTALSQLINAKIDIGVPQVKLLEFNQIPEVVGSEEKVMVGIMLMLAGDVRGMMMFMMEPEVAKEIVDTLMCGMCPVDKNSMEFNEMEQSAVMEIGNIIAGAYLRALGELTGLTFDITVPMIQIDMVGAILSVPAIEFGKLGDKVLIIETAFDDEVVRSKNAVKGYYLLVPDVESYEKMLSALGV